MSFMPCFPLPHDDDPSIDRGLWFAGGDFFTCRFYSRLLAMQIKAEDDGVFEAGSS